MLAGFRLFLVVLISIFLFGGTAWSQQPLRKASKNQGEIKEINKDLPLERPIKEERENPISQEKLKTPQEILYGQQDQATKSSTRRKVKVPSRAIDRKKNNSKNLTGEAGSASKSGIPIGPSDNVMNQPSETTKFIDDYYKQKQKLSAETSPVKKLQSEPPLGGKLSTTEKMNKY